MGLMTEQVGLFQPSRWVWALSARVQLPGPPPCPFNLIYTVYQRNYSITPLSDSTYPTTTFVNGTLYSYFINETCNGLADAEEFAVDPLSSPYSAVADFQSQDYEGLVPGDFYTSLTRDDVAGMKYLYTTNNFNDEQRLRRRAGHGVGLTNDVPQFIQTQDLGALAAAAKVNNAAAALQRALFPV